MRLRSAALGAILMSCAVGACAGPVSVPSASAPPSAAAASVMPSVVASQAAPGSESADPLATPTIDGAFAVADGRKLAIRCWGEGDPTVVLVGGHPSAGIADFEGQRFLRPLVERARVCAYSRSGYRGSDPAPDQPRTADHLIADLHDLLEAADVDPPYVLVGSSFGGMIVTYYAAKHPEGVAGVVMLDVPAPDASLTYEQIPEIAWDHPANPEHTDTLTGFEHRFARERLPISAPLTVVTATGGQSDVADQAIWLEISPSATQVELPGSHDIYVSDPDGVAAEILKHVDEGS